MILTHSVVVVGNDFVSAILVVVAGNDIVSATVVDVVNNVVVGNDIVRAIVVVVVVVIVVVGNDIVRGVVFFDSLPLDLYWSLNVYYLSKLLIICYLNPVYPYIPLPTPHYFFLSISTSQCCLL